MQLLNAWRRRWVTITRVHRADDRDIDELKSGFTCWNPVWQKAPAANAKNFIMRLLDESHNVTGLVELAQEILKPVKYIFKPKDPPKQPTLATASATIKRVLKDRRAFWVSTSENKECGGYADSYKHVYQIDLPKPLKQHAIIPAPGSSANWLVEVDDRTNPLIPSICYDEEALIASNIIAINSGPLHDVEITFLTSIDASWITKLR